jgi:hypothetical protein
VLNLQCYKHVSALLLKAGNKSGPTERVNVVFCISAILRKSKVKFGDKDMYGTAVKVVFSAMSNFCFPLVTILLLLQWGELNQT